MKKIVILLGTVLLVYAFNELSSFQKKLLTNLTIQVDHLKQEKVYLHTDKSAYTIGENVWFRAYLVDAARMFPTLHSSYVYVDLVDQRDSLIQRVKVAHRDSCFYGQLPLSKNLQQGDYCLRAFTYYMQNGGEEYFFKKKIRIMNPEDTKVWTNVSYSKNPKGGYTATIRLTNAWGEPYVQTPLYCIVGRLKGANAAQQRWTDKDGKLEVKIDSTQKVIEVGFRAGRPFPFKRLIHVPARLKEFDVQFFPEGGSLLAGNYQYVAFKAIGADGQAVEVTGDVYQDSVVIATFNTSHDGMGKFRLPVNSGCRLHTVARMVSGEEKRFDLPEVSDTGWGITVSGRDSLLYYRVIKGERAVLPEELYAVVHCRGLLLGSNRVNGLLRGSLDLDVVPEGISHLVLIDGEGKVYSQRLFFEKSKQRPGLKITTNEPAYSIRDLVEMEIDFDESCRGKLEGTFSVSVTDDQKVVQDSLENNILSALLLTSDLKGYIDRPGYYFSPAAGVDDHLDLVMLTHGWTRFDISKVAMGDFGKLTFPLEVGQMISGVVKNFWGKKSKGANIVLLSSSGIFQMAETDGKGQFMIKDLVFPDSTMFLMQALSAKGRWGVSVKLDRDEFLPPSYAIPNTFVSKKEEDDFLEKFRQNYYYENGEKVYVLDEVLVARNKKKSYSFYDKMARYQLDSAYIAANSMFSITRLVEQIPGVTFAVDEDGMYCFQSGGSRLLLVVNEIEEDVSFVRKIPTSEILSISLLGGQMGQAYFGDEGANGALIIAVKPEWMSQFTGRPNISFFNIMGYQEPDEFYVPKYDVDTVRLNQRRDERATIYWKPVVKIGKDGPAKLSFYTADRIGTYSVIVEGITSEGIISRKRISLELKLKK